MSAAIPTSACTPTTRALLLSLAVFAMAATASSSVSLPRATMATSAPDCAKRVATAKPMPLLPPVTIAERPERVISMKRSHDPHIGDRAIPSVAGRQSEGPCSTNVARHPDVLGQRPSPEGRRSHELAASLGPFILRGAQERAPQDDGEKARLSLARHHAVNLLAGRCA